MKQIHNFDLSIITEEMVNDFAQKVGLGYKDAREMLIEILDEEYAE